MNDDVRGPESVTPPLSDTPSVEQYVECFHRLLTHLRINAAERTEFGYGLAENFDPDDTLAALGYYSTAEAELLKAQEQRDYAIELLAKVYCVASGQDRDEDASILAACAVQEVRVIRGQLDEARQRIEELEQRLAEPDEGGLGVAR